MNTKKYTVWYCTKYFMVLCPNLVHCIVYVQGPYLIYSVLSLHGEFLHSRRQHGDSYYSSFPWVDVHMLQFTVLQLILGFYLAYTKEGAEGNGFLW